VEEKKFTEKQLNGAFEAAKKEAVRTLNDPEKLEQFFQKLERKIEKVPLVGDKLSYVPIMASLIHSFVRKEYRDISIWSIVAVLASLIYFVSPIDLIPDVVPVVGLADDAAVIGIALKVVGDDLKAYKAWRDANGKTFADDEDFEAEEG